MPVPVETFRNIKKVNVVFAASSVLTVVVMLWMLKHDFERPWREIQNDYFDLQSAMNHFKALGYESPQEKEKRAALEKAVDDANAELSTPQAVARATELAARQRRLEGELQGVALTFGNLNAELQVMAFQYEEHKTLHGPDHPKTTAALAAYKKQQESLAEAKKTKDALEDQLAEAKARIKSLYEKRDKAVKDLASYDKGRDDALRNDTLYGTPLAIGPIGIGYRTIFNMPMLDFAAPTGTPGRQEIKQVFTQDVRFSYNFLDSYVTDRCMTCHVAIDNPDFTEENFLKNGHAALATERVQQVVRKENDRLIVLLDKRLVEAGEGLDLGAAPAGSDEAALKAKIQADAERLARRMIRTANEFLAEHERPPIRGAEELAASLAGQENVSRGQILDAVTSAAKAILRVDRPLVKDRPVEYAAMSPQQRADQGQALAAALNAYLVKEGRPKIRFGQPLLAHPNLDMYVSADSAHPMKTVGCTVCHEGSGQETDFIFAAHTPKTRAEEAAWEKQYYMKELGVPQATFHLVQEFWERPMLLPGHTSASCAKCHDQIMDLERHRTERMETQVRRVSDDGVPREDVERLRIVEGAQLFTSVGCINCHYVEGLGQSRKVGPDLAHVGEKLTTGFMERWVEYPAEFRPSTRMPHFFKQENNLPSSRNDDDPDPIARTETEIQAIVHYLRTFSTPYDPRPLPEGLTGDAARGEQLFTSIGCLACHANLSAKDPTDESGRSIGERWITTELVRADGLSEEDAGKRYAEMTQNDRVRFAMRRFDPYRRERAQAAAQAEEVAADREGREPDPARMYVPPAFTRVAPELSGIGSKLAPVGDDAEQRARGTRWLYNWLRDPRHYSSDTNMPRLFEDNYYWKHPPGERRAKADQDLLDLATYLMTLRNDGFEASAIPDDEDHQREMERLILILLGGLNTETVSRKILNDEKADSSEPFGRLTAALVSQVGKAFGPGEEGRRRVAEIVGSQGLRDRQRLYLGLKMITHYGCYACHNIAGFEGAANPGTELTTWGQKFMSQLDFAFYSPPFHHEIDKQLEVFGKLYRQDEESVHLRRDIGEDGATLDTDVLHNHASFAYHKLRNPRIWDRAKIKRPYDKLKMPNFYFTDEEAQSLVTYLLSRKTPLVRPSVQIDYANTPAGKIAKGRHLVRELNCIGCHVIEGTTANIQQYYRDDPSLNDMDPIGFRFTPPMLWGEGAKVQTPWLYKFLNRVEMLRPWLNVRMPTFYLTNEEATILAEYFVGVGQDEALQLREELRPIAERLAEAHAAGAAVDWHTEDGLAERARFLARYAVAHKQITPYALNSDEPGPVYDSIREKTELLGRALYAEYPFPSRGAPAVDEARFRLGEEFFHERKCLACHVAGDPSVPGTTVDIKAPNFALTFERLRYDWVRYWVQEPKAFMPGTNMPQVFPAGHSAFETLPPEQRAELEKKFGSTGQEQMDLLIDFVYELGNRRYTTTQPGGLAPPPGQPSGEGGTEFDFDAPAAPTSQPAAEFDF